MSTTKPKRQRKPRKPLPPSIRKRLGGKGGIYAIINKVNDRFYIGCTSDFAKRISNYRSYLNNKRTKINSNLKEDLDKYGREAFVFRIIEVVTAEEAKDRNFLEALEHTYLCCAHVDFVYNFPLYIQRNIQPKSVIKEKIPFSYVLKKRNRSFDIDD